MLFYKRTIGNIVTGNDEQTQYILSLGILSIFHTLLGHSKKAIRKETLWTISNICAGSIHQIQAVIDAHLIPKIIERISTDDFDVQQEGLWALSNCCGGASLDQLDYLIQCGIISKFCEALPSSNVKHVLVALEGLKGLAGYYGMVDDNMDLVKSLIAEEGMQLISELLSHDDNEVSSIASEIHEMLQKTQKESI